MVVKKFVFYVGGGVILVECSNEFVDFVKKLNLFVISLLMGLGVYFSLDC